MTGHIVFECEAASLDDADEKYECTKGIAPVKQTHIATPEIYESFGHFVIKCFEK